MITFKLTVTPLESFDFRDMMRCDQAGAYNTFEGVVRNHNNGHEVTALEYEVYEELCEKEALKILAEAKKNFNIIDAKCFHRVGKLAIGEMAVFVGVTADHRDDSFGACRYIIDEIKTRLPIWKKEYYKSGDSGWVNCNASLKRKSQDEIAV